MLPWRGLTALAIHPDRNSFSTASLAPRRPLRTSARGCRPPKIAEPSLQAEHAFAPAVGHPHRKDDEVHPQSRERLAA